MKIRKRFKIGKNAARFICAFAVIFAVVFTVTCGRYRITVKGISPDAKEYKGILRLWNIDSFEGGTGSRKQFLMSVARGFEKKHNGVLIMAVDRTAESALKAMERGEFPDMISYGTGVAPTNLSEIGINVYSAGGGKNGDIYAVPWCRGGYCVIENPDYKLKKDKNTGALKEEPIIVSQGEFTDPLLAYALSGKTLDEFTVYTPMNAYVAFTAGKGRYMLGTQRDINRLLARKMDFISSPISEYNDLFQYISITTNDQTKYEYAKEFVKYLVGEDVQSRLDEIGMYSCYCAVNYQDQDMSEMQKAKSRYVLSAFSSRELVAELQSLSAKAVTGDKDSLNIIKKLLFIS